MLCLSHHVKKNERCKIIQVSKYATMQISNYPPIIQGFQGKSKKKSQANLRKKKWSNPSLELLRTWDKETPKSNTRIENSRATCEWGHLSSLYWVRTSVRQPLQKFSPSHAHTKKEEEIVARGVKRRGQREDPIPKTPRIRKEKEEEGKYRAGQKAPLSRLCIRMVEAKMR